jgi:hypothetical protein
MKLVIIVVGGISSMGRLGTEKVEHVSSNIQFKLSAQFLKMSQRNRTMPSWLKMRLSEPGILFIATHPLLFSKIDNFSIISRHDASQNMPLAISNQLADTCKPS